MVEGEEEGVGEGGVGDKGWGGEHESSEASYVGGG